MDWLPCIGGSTADAAAAAAKEQAICWHLFVRLANRFPRDN